MNIQFIIEYLSALSMNNNREIGRASCRERV